MSEPLVAGLLILYGAVFSLLVLILLKKVSEVHILVNSKMTEALEKIKLLELTLAKERRENID